MTTKPTLIPLLPPRERARWRSLAEWYGEPADAGEFAPGADLPPSALNRREFLALTGAALALAGASGCSRDLPDEILAYSRDARGVVPGVPNYFATSMVLDGLASGLLVESHEGRPTKIEGNPAHPASLGGTTLFQQASIYSLYDPARGRRVRHLGADATWDALWFQLSEPRADQGNGLRLLLEPTSSPLTLSLIALVRERHPRLKITYWSPCHSRAGLDGSRLALGRALSPVCDLSRADVIVSFDADFLPELPRHARDWAQRRRPDGDINRLYAVEPALSVTGSMADHRLSARPSEMARLAAAIAVFLPSLDPMARRSAERLECTVEERRWAQIVARDLSRHRGRALVMMGDRLPAELHALGCAMNAALDAPRHFIEPLCAESDQDLAALTNELRSGEVGTLLIAGANPVYAAPAALDFAGALKKVSRTIYLGPYENETAARCAWYAPERHYLESWGDARAFDGTHSLIQPLVKPLYGARQLEQLLGALAGFSHTDPYVKLRESFGTGFEPALQCGFVDGAAPAVPTTLAWSADLSQLPSAPAALEISFARSAVVHDGRFANNPWLQETPQPITKLTWDNAALMSVDTARALGVTDDDLLQLSADGRSVKSAALIVPGHADGCITLTLGYGRSGAESLAATAGFNVYPLRGSYSARVEKIGRYALAHTQRHFSMEGRGIALATTIDQYRRSPDALTKELKQPLPTLLPPVPQTGQQWAMAIDLSLCIGCSACTVACASENNLLVVGKDQVQKRREMDWLRIDSYYTGTPRAPSVIHQPMMCQHCENAPCEYVCPVNATVHSPDGLNEMVYNRCVGTRFCSNNCPYKVRRFNWFDWHARNDANHGEIDLQRNPDVTVRERGVMEKCTYCVQRIRETEIRASIDNRPIADGEIQTACQQACPTRAIRFGSLSNAESAVVAWRAEPRSYGVLHETGTSPRTQYLARVDNPNPELA